MSDAAVSTNGDMTAYLRDKVDRLEATLLAETRDLRETLGIASKKFGDEFTSVMAAIKRLDDKITKRLPPRKKRKKP